ncbi:MFS transporter [Actinomadura sp. 3N508]|uniref:MFS transporter n=1 Tax=Actinomadura sp. 3N508 TaxID=3375153 RepID=UPI0037B9B152
MRGEDDGRRLHRWRAGLARTSSLRRRENGIAYFGIVWFGLAISQLASATTNFALTVWLWQRSHQASPVALLELCSFAAVVGLSPVAGMLTDRWGRYRTLMLSNLVGALVMAFLWGLYGLGDLQAAFIYVAMLALGASLTLQFPAMMSLITVTVPSRHYARANGLVSLAVSVAGIGAPALGAALLQSAGLATILALDVLSYAVAAVTLLAVRGEKRMPAGPAPSGKRAAWRSDLTLGFRYIARKRGLLALQLCFFAFFFSSMLGVLQAPMILARTEGNAVLAGTLSAAGIGGLLGSLATTVFGTAGRSPRRVIFLGFVLTGLAGQLPLAVTTEPAAWFAASFAAGLILPAVLAAHQSLWHTIVPDDLQGRVFAARRILTESAGPIAMLSAGPLADHVFEPGMRGGLGSVAGPLVDGTGPGSGMALILLLAALLSVATGLAGLRLKSVRALESDSRRLLGDPAGAPPERRFDPA